ncbi:MAG TPA: ATP-binding protein, partial [Acidobacteriaceae bacterium]|nr:ATP-binding protein [Acidobacteriaceae bacterium]
MRRRSKRAPNLSEQTGKIGQELPANQPAPLQPNYASADYTPPSTQPPQTKPARAKASELEKPLPVLGRDPDDASHESDAAADDTTVPSASDQPIPEGKLILETQPESPSAVPPEASGGARPSRGFVVLTIGL